MHNAESRWDFTSLCIVVAYDAYPSASRAWKQLDVLLHGVLRSGTEGRMVHSKFSVWTQQFAEEEDRCIERSILRESRDVDLVMRTSHIKVFSVGVHKISLTRRP